MILYHMYCMMMAHANLNAPFCPGANGGNSASSSASSSTGGDSNVQTTVNIYSPVNTASNAANSPQSTDVTAYPAVPAQRFDNLQSITTASARSQLSESSIDTESISTQTDTETISPTEEPTPETLHETELGAIPTPGTVTPTSKPHANGQPQVSTASPLDNLPTSTFPSIPPFGMHPMFTPEGIQTFGQPQRANSRMSDNIYTPMMRLDTRKSTNLSEEEINLIGYFDLARKYMQISFVNSTKNFNQAVTPISLITLAATLQFTESDCTKLKDGLIFSMSPASVYDKLPYREFLTLNIVGSRYEKCKSVNLAPTLNVTVKNDKTIKHVDTMYTFDLTSAWSNFAFDHCSIGQDNFESDDATVVKTDYLTLYGSFESGWIESISSKYVSLPFPGYETSKLKMVIILPTTAGNIVEFAKFFYNHLGYGDFSEGTQITKKLVLPHIFIDHMFFERAQSPTSSPLRVKTFIDISASKEDNPSCEVMATEDDSETIKVNRTFIFLIMWKTAHISSGIVEKIKN